MASHERPARLSPLKSRQLQAWWAPLWPGNHALWQAAWADPKVVGSWETSLEAYDAWLTLAPHAPEAQVALREYAERRLQDLLACFERQAPRVGLLFRHFLPDWLRAAAEYRCTGVIPPWTPRVVAQPTPEICISITPEGHALGYARAPRQHRRLVDKYLDIVVDAPGPGRPRGRGPTLEEMLTAARQLKGHGEAVTQRRLMEQMGIRGEPRRVYEWLQDLGPTWREFQELI